MTLLVVDDDPTFLAQVDERLGSDRDVFFAQDASRARDLLATVGSSLSAVLVDLNLPDQDGFSFIRELHKGFPTLPIVAISGVFQGDVLESARLLGANETLAKPITAEWKPTIEHAIRSHVVGTIHHRCIGHFKCSCGMRLSFGGETRFLASLQHTFDDAGWRTGTCPRCGRLHRKPIHSSPGLDHRA